MAKARMLLVEDDASLAELLVWHFTREHFDVQHTIDGEEALLMAKETPPDIVLLDWMVEGISGIEVCRRLRADPATERLPVLIISGHRNVAQIARDSGATDYLPKPFSLGVLEQRIQSLLVDGECPPGFDVSSAERNLEPCA